MRFLCLLMILMAAAVVTPAQFCNPTRADYIVRDEKGKVVSGPDLKSIAEQLPEEIGDASVYPGEIAQTSDGSYLWPESVEWQSARKQPAMGFSNAGTCKMFLGEVTLTYHNRKMHLVFNLNTGRGETYHRLLVDSLPFQEGTFKLDMTDWPEGDKLVPATRWKRVSAGRRLLDKKSG